MSMDMDGADSARQWVDEAGAEHPSLVDTDHQLDALFGVVNVPNVIWIDEDGIIVRPPEPGWAAPVQYPEWLSSRLEEQVRKALEDAAAEGREPIDPRRTMARRPGPRRLRRRRARLGPPRPGQPVRDDARRR